MKATDHTYIHAGKVFRLHVSETPEELEDCARCAGCAFIENPGACSAAKPVDCTKRWPEIGIEGVWIEDKPWLPDDRPGWVEWSGGECPVDGDLCVEVVMRRERKSRRIDFDPNPAPKARGFSWGHNGSPGDIVAYRGADAKKPTTADEPGWVEWHGGDKPPSAVIQPGIRVQLRFRSGYGIDAGDAGRLRWAHRGTDGDIVAYRISGPASASADQGATAEVKPSNPKDVVGIRKAPLSCVPMNVVAEMGLGMLEGGCKYGRHNFRSVGVRSSVYFDAAMRHLIAWWEGEDIDPDSGMHHVAKALTCLAVLRDAQHQGLCTDDRPPRSAPFYDSLNVLAGQILDRHKDKTPRHYTIEDTK